MKRIYPVIIPIVLLLLCFMGNTAFAQCTCTSGCSSLTAITMPFSKDGAGEFCYQAACIGAPINSWNMSALVINGVDFTNKWADSSALPAAASDGYYYIYYNGLYSYSHFEATGSCSGGTTAAPTTPPTDTQIVTAEPTTPASETPGPTDSPTETPAPTVTPGPTSIPTATPYGVTDAPTAEPTATPDAATLAPTDAPTAAPTDSSTAAPGTGALLVGRFNESDAAGPKFGWSATTIRANFQGTDISVKLASTGDNYMNVIVDGIVLSKINVPAGTSGSTPISLATGLSTGSHTIELVRRTEAWVGDMQFLGFTFSNGSLLTPSSASSRRIEMIGDSITCGYGNEGTSQYQSFTTANENAYLAYGSVAARLLGADQITVAWSGKGVIRNYGGDTTDVFPVVYPRILPYDTTTLWDASKWIPHVVVINLCTNDYSIGIPDTTQFTTAYINFVTTIRTQYPSAHIYCALGPMLSGDNLVSARTNLNSVVASFNNSGDTKVHFIEFPMQDGTLGYGEDWHPSVATHALMGTQLAAQIQTDLGW